MAIDDNTKYGLTGAQIKDLAAKVKAAGGLKTLTSADYNWPTNNPTGFAPWLLETGVYLVAGNVSYKFYASSSSVNQFGVSGVLIVDHPISAASGDVAIYYSNIVKWSNTESSATIETRRWHSNGTTAQVISKAITTQNVYNDLDSTAPGNSVQVLDARQGKVLKDLIDSLIIKDAGAPTTATVGTVGKLYEDITNGKLYQCTAVSGSTYTWTEVGSGGGGVKVLSTSDYDWPTANPNGVATWLLDDGFYRSERGTNSYMDKTSSAGYYPFFFAFTSEGLKNIIWYHPSDKTWMYNQIDPSSGTRFSSGYVTPRINNSLTQTSSGYALDARQGKVLKDMVGDLTSLTTVEKTNLVGAINEVAAGGGGEGIKVLTTDDYNWNFTTQAATNPNGVALWLLDKGVYVNGDGIRIGSSKTNSISNSVRTIAIVGEADSNGKKQVILFNPTYPTNSLAENVAANGNVSTWAHSLVSIAGNLVTTETGHALDATQGKVLKDDLDKRIIFGGTSAPTTSTVGQVSTLYVCVLNMVPKMYVCTDTTGGVYTWTEFAPEPVPTPEIDPTDSSMDVSDNTPIANGEVDLSGTEVEIENNTLDLGE